MNFYSYFKGFLNLKWAVWKRVLVTRSLAIVPTFCVAFFSTIQDLTGMNIILNAVMALQLPFAAIPMITFTSSRHIMGEFANGIANKIMANVFCGIIIGINIFFVISQVNQLSLKGWVLGVVSK